MRAELTIELAGFQVVATLAAEPGEVVALVGPNGAGKTTLLRALAGLQPATGSLRLGGREALHLPPQDRDVGWVPQAGLLFPHLSALDNAAYGLRARGRRQARATAQAWLNRLGVGELARCRPGQLSGGQAQRVALARALAPDPALVLLDEPLAALDAATRDEVRRVVRATLPVGRAAAVVVTHDPVDALVLADRVVVLEAGRVVQDGPAAQVAAAPRSAWAAGLLGLNAWQGICDRDGVRPDVGGHVAAAEPLPAGTLALALADPASVALHRRPPDGSPRTVLAGPVREITALGSRVRVLVASTPPVLAEVTAGAAAALGLAAGEPVFAAVKATEVRLVALDDGGSAGTRVPA